MGVTRHRTLDHTYKILDFYVKRPQTSIYDNAMHDRVCEHVESMIGDWAQANIFRYTYVIRKQQDKLDVTLQTSITLEHGFTRTIMFLIEDFSKKTFDQIAVELFAASERICRNLQKDPYYSEPYKL